MPGCSFCGHANPPGASRCELCGQELLVPPSQSMAPSGGMQSGGVQSATRAPDLGFASGAPRGATQELFDARSAAPSRYDVTPTQQSSRDSMPPPGWGPKGSTTSWTLSSQRVQPTPVVPVKARKVSGRNWIRELRGYAVFLAIVLAVGVGVFVFFSQRANSVEMRVTILGPLGEPVAGKLVVRGPDGSTLFDKGISNEGAKCMKYKRYDTTIRVKKSTEYTFEWSGVASTSVSDADLAAARYALILDTRGGTYVTPGAPEQVC